MSLPKRTRTRKQKTLRRTLALVLLLGAAIHFHLLILTPTQAIRATEDWVGLKPTEIVLEKDGLYLSENEDVLLLTAWGESRWYDRHFHAPPTAILDKSKHQPAVGGGFWGEDHGENREVFHLVGEVFPEDVVSVRAYSNIDPSYHYRSIELTAEVFQAENGKRYFWSVTERDMEKLDILPSALDLLDRQGNILYTISTQNNWYGVSKD